MKRIATVVLLSLFLLSTMAAGAQAHTPITPDDNWSLATAVHIEDPAKSWAIYSHIHEGYEAAYYDLDTKIGDRIYVSLFVPRDDGFLPGFVLMGPGISSMGLVPGFVEVPAGYGAIVSDPLIGKPTFEPFTPASNYGLANLDIKAPEDGRYYIAVFSQDKGGDYGLAVGYSEEYTPTEWVLIPYDLVQIYRWEGQEDHVIFLPGVLMALFYIAVVLVIASGKGIDMGPFHWVVILSAASLLGTATMISFQIGFSMGVMPEGAAAVWVSFLFLVASAGLGIWATQLAFTTDRRSAVVTKTLVVVIGLLALFLWAGLYVGPALAFAAAFLPLKGKAPGPVADKEVEEEAEEEVDAREFGEEE